MAILKVEIPDEGLDIDHERLRQLVLETLQAGIHDEGGVLRLSGVTVAKQDLATGEEIEEARSKYAYDSDNDIEVDDGACVSRADNGVWVQAWVWLGRDPFVDPEGVPA